MALLDLDPDELLSTTRAVRKRLDLTRPVPDELIRECVAMALQAPSGSNVVTMQFVVVTDPATVQAVGEIYRQVYAGYKASAGYAGRHPATGPPPRPRREWRVRPITWASTCATLLFSSSRATPEATMPPRPAG